MQAEAELPFGALSELLAPVLDGLAELPAPQADALRAALALGPPSPGDRLAVCVATVVVELTGAGIVQPTERHFHGI